MNAHDELNKALQCLYLVVDESVARDVAMKVNNAMVKDAREHARLREALEKIADPRKRDHTEPDAYTQLGCVMNIAEEALKGES